MAAGDAVIVTIRHVRAAKMCGPGARVWFARHGLDYGRFLREGLPADQLLATGCALAKRVVEVAREQQQ